MVTAHTELTEFPDTEPERQGVGFAPASPLTATESVLWKIERDPALRSTIIAVAVLEGSVDVDRFRRRVRLAAEAYPRLRQRVTRTRRGALLWSETSDWDIDQHVTHVRLPAPGSMRQLLDLAGEQAGEAFDPARPVWHLTLVEGLGRDRSALIVKLHHAMADGVGGIGLLWLFTDSEPHPRSEIEPPAATSPKRRRDGPSVIKTAASLTAAVVGAAITDPLATVRSAPKVARSTVRMLAPATSARSPLTTGRGLDRHLDVIEVPLRGLERAGHAVNGSVNDAFMAAIVGGLHRYHVAHGEDPTELRVTMPISVRRAEDDPGGNRFTPARFTLPLGIDDPARRMEEIGTIARRWRREPAVGMTDVLATALAQLPDAVTTSLFGSMLKGVDFMATNVPGARHRCWLAGAEVVHLYGFGPTSGSALNIALVSHLDTCDIGLNIDTAAIGDPDLLRASIEAGFAEVVAVGRSRRNRRGTSHAAPTTQAAARTSAAVPRRLSALDASFLEAETDITPMHIGALIMLEGDPLRDQHGALRIDDIRAAIAATLARSPRMLQVVRAVPFARPVWEDASTFDIEAHVKHVRVPAPGTRAELEALCHDLQMKVLDRSRPLWEMWFVDGLADGAVALVSKVHHAIVDGVSASETFEVLLGEQAPPLPSDPPTPATVALPRPVETFGALVADAAAGTRVWLTTGAKLATDPARAVATAIGLGELVRPSALAPRTSLNRPVGSHRRLVPVTFDVATLKAIAHRHGATVNDVLLTLVGCGLHQLLAGRGEQLDHLQVLVPVSLRDADEHNGAGNRVGALIVPVRLSRDPVAALAATNAITRIRKRGPEAAAFDLLLRTSDTWPAGLLGPVSRQIVHHQPFVNLVVTNVRGSERPLTLLDSRITEIVPIVPLGGNLDLGVAALSYAGRMVVAIHADADACPDVDVVAGGIETAFARLQRS